MALYRYVKAPPQKPRGPVAKRILSASFMLVGVLLIVWVVYPIISFELTSRVRFAEIVIPVPESYESNAFSVNKQANSSASVESTIETFSNLARSVSDIVPLSQTNEKVMGSSTQPQTQEVDYTKASNWFPSKPQGYANTAGRIYFMSIPKLKIKDAIVKIAGDDLNETLIHYGGTGLPGEYGTSVVFGHSILPQFYDPDNYKAIFSHLPKLSEGDEIFIKYDGITYRYVVMNMRVTSPEDITVLEQRYDSAYVRLITCVPPGTYWKRLAVTARLQPV